MDIRARRGPLLALAALAVATPPLAAQTPRTITFDEAIRIALAENPTFRLARSAAALDSVAVLQQRGQFFPDLRITAQGAQNYGRNFSESEGRIINQSTQAVNTGLASSVVLFDGLANVASLREAQLTRTASERDARRAEQAVVFTVVSNYLTLVQEREQLRVRRENVAAEQALEQQIQAYVDAGVRSIADLYQQQANVASARFSLVEAERLWDLAKVDLMQTLQLDPRGSYIFESPEISTAPAPGPQDSLEAMLARAVGQRQDLAAEEARQQAAQEGIRVARAGRWPTVSLGAGYNTAFTTAADPSFFDQLDQRRGGAVALGVSFPIFDRGTTRLATERAEIEAERARITLDNQRNEVGLQVRRAFLDYHAAEAQLRAAEVQLRAADLALTTSQERYQAGAATLVELTQVRAAQVGAASALVSARYNLVFQRTLMAYYVGDLDPRQVTVG